MNFKEDKNYYTALLLLLVTCLNIHATAQMEDELKWDGKTHHISSNPLEDFWTDSASRPKFVYKKSFLFGDVTFSNNWRGYTAKYEIEDTLLYLTKIRGWIGNRRAKLSEIFPEKVKNGKVFCDWYSGVLRLRKGDMLKYTHMGYMSTTQFEIEIRIQNGRMICIDTVRPLITYGYKNYREFELRGYNITVPEGFMRCHKTYGDSSCLIWDELKMSLVSKIWHSRERKSNEKQIAMVKKNLDSLLNSTTSMKWETEQSRYRYGYRAIALGFEDSVGTAYVFIANIHAFLWMRIMQEDTSPMRFAKNIDVITKTVELFEYGY